MNSRRHILLVDEDDYRRRDHAFLLKIGGFEVQSLKTPMEALNWLSINHASHPAELILLEGFSGLRHDRQVFDLVEEVSAMVPVLIVDRDPATGKQILWSKCAAEPTRIAAFQRHRMITDIVRSFLRGDLGEENDGEMAHS